MSVENNEVVDYSKHEVVDFQRDGLLTVDEYDKKAGNVNLAQWLIQELTDKGFKAPTVWLRYAGNNTAERKAVLEQWATLPMSAQRYFVNRAICLFLADADAMGYSSIEIRTMLINDGPLEDWQRLVKNNFCAFLLEQQNNLQ